MKNYLFRVLKIEYTENGEKMLDRNWKDFEREISASSNHEAISKGMDIFKEIYPNENLDNYAFSSITW